MLLPSFYNEETGNQRSQVTLLSVTQILTSMAWIWSYVRLPADLIPVPNSGVFGKGSLLKGYQQQENPMPLALATF